MAYKLGDMSKLARDLEDVLQSHFPEEEGRIAIGICFTLPRDYGEAHWVTNVGRKEGIMLFELTAEKMKIQDQN